MRQVDEWIGANDDVSVPQRVEFRVFARQDGRCAKCGRKIGRGNLGEPFDLDHIIALANGGQHRESNLQALCRVPCHSQKTKSDVAQKSRTASIRKRAAGIRKPSKFACAKDKPFKKKITGEVVRR